MFNQLFFKKEKTELYVIHVFKTLIYPLHDPPQFCVVNFILL